MNKEQKRKRQARRDRRKRMMQAIAGPLGLLGATTIRGWMSTLSYKWAGYDWSLDPASPRFPGQAIFLFWHEYIPLPVYLRGKCHFATLLSRHIDAEVLARAAGHLGVECVRGSTSVERGGAAAIRELLAKSRRLNLCITPDGPRGPRRQLAPGSIFLASKLQVPLILMGFGYDRPWRMRTWDEFAIPRPYSRARAILSPQIPIPGKLDRDGIEHYRRQVERLLNRLTEDAESWAESGARRSDEVAARPEPPRRRLIRRGSTAPSETQPVVLAPKRAA